MTSIACIANATGLRSGAKSEAPDRRRSRGGTTMASSQGASGGLHRLSPAWYVHTGLQELLQVWLVTVKKNRLRPQATSSARALDCAVPKQVVGQKSNLRSEAAGCVQRDKNRKFHCAGRLHRQHYHPAAQ
ncbi:hypothetical protein WJX84_012417 [Apatococcus fuscideae]|uniref:Uncharacterized protein n=1 Tax=Apatococcus fuscideae TaxID=2026836 RepID=A0AAW1T3T4_9CHLO